MTFYCFISYGDAKVVRMLHFASESLDRAGESLELKMAEMMQQAEKAAKSQARFKLKKPLNTSAVLQSVKAASRPTTVVQLPPQPLVYGLDYSPPQWAHSELTTETQEAQFTLHTLDPKERMPKGHLEAYEPRGMAQYPPPGPPESDDEELVDPRESAGYQEEDNLQQYYPRNNHEHQQRASRDHTPCQE
jgi:hypothetical protein